MKKRIIFSSYDDIANPYYAGGGAIAVHEIAKRLVVWYDVLVITANHPHAKNEIIDGVQYERIGLKHSGPRIGQLIFSVLIPFILRRKKFDVWIESFTPPFSTSFLPLHTHKPVIGLAHMLAGEDMERKYKLPFTKIENIGLKKYSECIVVTDHMRKVVHKINPHCAIAVIPNGIDIPTTEKKEKKGKDQYILYLGRIEIDQKGLDLLLKAYASRYKEIGLPLIIAGTGTEKEIAKLQTLIEKYSLQQYVHVLGRIEGSNKKELLSHCSFLVMPSRFESFGLVALEAFSYAKPVITFDVDMLNWLPNASTLKIPSFSVEELSKGMMSLANNKDKRIQMGNAGRKIAEKYTWDEIAHMYKSVLERVIQ